MTGRIIHGDNVSGAGETILEEAGRLTSGDRREAYDHPYENFERIAALWRAYLKAKGCGHVTIDREDVARMNILQKIARDVFSPRRDNIVDVAGYARTLELIRERPKPLEAERGPLP